MNDISQDKVAMLSPDDVQLSGGVWPALGMAIGGLVTGGLWLRNKLSKDAVGRSADQAELGIITTLQKEVARLTERNTNLETRVDEVNAEKNILHREKAQIESQVTILSDQVARLEQTVSEMNQRLASVLASQKGSANV